MELRNLHSFLRVAELGNFSRAAEDLGYAQSTVTIQIQQLEAEIGQPLFERFGKRVYLTDQGNELVNYANQMLRLEQQIALLGQMMPLEIKGSIRIGAVSSIANSLLLPILKEYQQRFPNIGVQVITAVSSDLYELLRHNEVDVIYTMGPKENPEDCICVASRLEYAVFVATADHPLARCSEISAAEIFDYPLILNGENTFLQQELRLLAVHCRKEVRPHIQTHSSNLIVNLAVQGMGIAFLAGYRIQSAMNAHALVVLPVRDYSLPFYVQVFYHKNKWETPQMRELAKLTETYWQADNDGGK